MLNEQRKDEGSRLKLLKIDRYLKKRCVTEFRKIL